MKLVANFLKKCLQATFLTTLMITAKTWAGVVTVSNYPLALLSQAVTQGQNDAQVLLSAGDVGHHGALSPSKIKLIADSDFVVWFGESLEQNLVNTLKDSPNDIALLDFNAFERLPQRQLDGSPKPDSQDVHLWLEPQNAKAIVRALAVIHSHANPEHAQFYQKNAQDFALRMDQAVALFAKSPKKPYWAYHDSYQYLERAANLEFAGALTPDHHLSPKASQLKFLAQHRPQEQMCLASQGPVSAGIQNKLAPLVVSVQQEDMSGGPADFVEAWSMLVKDLQKCSN